jgi:hypothetical protein
MLDRTSAGARCRTVWHINTRDRLLPRDTHGTIRYEGQLGPPSRLCRLG